MYDVLPVSSVACIYGFMYVVLRVRSVACTQCWTYVLVCLDDIHVCTNYAFYEVLLYGRVGHVRTPKV